MQTSPPRTRCSIATWLVVAALACAALVGCGADKTDQGPDGLAALDGGTGGDIVNPAAVDASVGLGDAGPPKPPMDPPAGAGFTCEVKTLLATKCQVCHTDPPQGGAVVPLLTVAQMFEWSKTDPTKLVAEVALARMQDTKSPMPPAFFNASVTPEDVSAFEAWILGNYQGSCAGNVPISATCTTCHGETGRAGIAGTDANFAAAPPRGSKGETATTMRAVGAHQAHVNRANLIGAPLACTDCHVVPTAMSHSDQVVDMAFGPLAKVAGASPVWNGATCANTYCHGKFPGGTSVFAPSWTGGAMTCGSCHGTPPPTPEHTNATAECSLCHGAGYSATAKTVNKATHINGVINVDQSALTCTSCHGDNARAAIAGADAQVKASPPIGSSGETLATQRGVGAHQAHVNKASLVNAPFACSECHVLPTSTSHSNGVIEIAFGGMSKTAGATPAWNGATCTNSYCHGKFNGGLAGTPTWTNTTPMACGSCHGTPPATPPHAAAAGQECSNCHGAGYSATAKTVNKATHIDGAVQSNINSQTCSTCHGDAARAGVLGADPQVKAAPPVGTKGETLASTRAVGAHQAHVNKGTLSLPVACNECHLVPITNSHSNAVVDISFGTIAKTGGAVPAWNGTACTNSYCHGKFTGGNAATAPAWTSGPVACNSCHALPPATPAHSNPALECSTCHGPGYSANAQTVNAATHVNGVVNVDQGALTCFGCHGDGARAAVAGADPQLKSAPPKGSKGETLTSTRAVGAHQAHVATGAMAMPIACNECHLVPISNSHSNGAVDISFGSVAKKGGVAPTWNGTSCANSYCHGNFPGGRTIFAPAWTGGAMTCGSCHATPPATAPHTNPALECSVCHGAGYSATAGTVNKTTHVNGVVNVDSNALTCTSCHGDAKRVGIAGADARISIAPPVGPRGETLTTQQAVGAHQAHLNKADFAAKPVQCTECHSVPSSNGHSDGVAQVVFGAFAKTGGVSPTWNATTNTCASTYCHGNFTGGSTLFTPNWVGSAMTCTSCHAAPPSTGDHSRHAKKATCADCHGTGFTYANAAGTVNKTLHLNGVKDVVTGGKLTTYDKTTRKCTTTCHGSETW